MPPVPLLKPSQVVKAWEKLGWRSYAGKAATLS